MSASVIWTTGLGVFLTFYQYLFFKEMLGTKHRYAYLGLYLGTWLYGHINVWLCIAGTVWGNFIYLCVCAFALNTLLFHGSIIKKIFFILWMYGVQEVASSIFFPLFRAIAVLNGREGDSDIILEAVNLLACLIAVVTMGILRRKLHLLKREFEDRDGIYLICMIAFICAATSMMATMMAGAREWDAGYIYAVVLPGVLIAVGGEILYVYLIVMLEQRLVEKLAKQRYQMLKQHMEISKEQYDQFVKIRHDMKNHSLCLTQLLANGNVEDAKRYLGQWSASIEKSGVSIRTGSVFADALLNPKYRQAKELGIDILIQMNVPGEEKIAPVDLCCLLANALDNAIEACKRGIEAGYPAGWIRMKSQIHSDYWVFEISNSTYIAVREHKGRFLSSKQIPMSGVGLHNIRTVVEQYGGVLDLESGACFTLNAMFPLP